MRRRKRAHSLGLASENGAAMVALLLPSMTLGLSRIAGGCLIRCTPSRSAADACVVDMPQAL